MVLSRDLGYQSILVGQLFRCSMGKIFISLVVGFIVIGTLVVYQATTGTSSVVLIPSELTVNGTTPDRTRIRVGGRVVDPVNYQIEPVMELRFRVEDPKDPKGSVPVVYLGLKPDMFAAGRDVLIDGDFSGGTIQAAKLLTQCPSKYEPPSPTDVKSAPAKNAPGSGQMGDIKAY